MGHIECVVSDHVKRFVDQGIMSKDFVEVLFRLSITFKENSSFIVFKNKLNSVVIEDGKSNIIRQIETQVILPNDIWVVREDFPEGCVYTMMLPDEYVSNNNKNNNNKIANG